LHPVCNIQLFSFVHVTHVDVSHRESDHLSNSSDSNPELESTVSSGQLHLQMDYQELVGLLSDGYNRPSQSSQVDPSLQDPVNGEMKRNIRINKCNVLSQVAATTVVAAFTANCKNNSVQYPNTNTDMLGTHMCVRCMQVM
jgi:hypothetical protein